MSIKVFVVNFVITAFWISFFLDSISLKFVRFMIYFFGWSLSSMKLALFQARKLLELSQLIINIMEFQNFKPDW